MSCNVISPAAPPTDSLFDDDWKNCGGDMDDLGAIAAFNDSFDDRIFDLGTKAGTSGDVDPQLLSTTAYPASMHTAFDGYDHAAPHGGNLDPSMFDFYSGPHVSGGAPPSAASPYFHQPWEQQFESTQHQRQLPMPSPLRNQLHRRSVSEPPDQHHLWPPQPQMMPTFTRSGTPLGTPRQLNGHLPRAASKARQPPYRQHFSVAKRQAPRQERYQLRRTQTQPVRGAGGPTSVPTARMVQSPPTSQMMMQQPVMMPPPPPQSHFVSSRVCTPAPEVENGDGADNVDHRLASSAVADKKQGSLSIPLTVDELKAMIKDAVREAVKAAVADFARSVPQGPTEDVLGERSEDVRLPYEEEEDTIQVAGAMEGVRKSIEEDDGFF